ncbi:unnamed protein product [Prorocentrum cordatum]|uniref:Uncharacterized protein n=1 Tax=Prorocentrum cordatum TaxID=2364126 RepID=A0ABN9WF52_9DINO|nr:unnamed protein product [Polarella glacialis]|mmetsp:Transcript_17081/g.45678  ORF Transcript_17081/g.45678 Transcript_17081/m.45678 type:complete len:288 (-) Transcript_17081:57-920(-)
MKPRAAVAALVAAALAPRSAEAIVKELYTTNAVCKQNNCVNPIFPALQELPKLEVQEWKKYSLDSVSGFMNFCKPFVNYDVAVPNISSSVKDKIEAAVKDIQSGKYFDKDMLPTYANPLQDAVALQDRIATKMYFYHLSGLGIEPWDHPQPAEESYHPMRGCARSVAAMTCYTHFPQAFTGLADKTSVSYMRPCRSCCESYIQACNVECCDESVTCVWDSSKSGQSPATTSKQTVRADGVSVLLEMGYADFEGPSIHCTGSGSEASRMAKVAVPTIAAGLAAFYYAL